MTIVRNLAIAALIALTIVMAAMVVVTWDLYVYLDHLPTTIATIAFSVGVLATYGSLIATAIHAHESR